MVNLFRGRRLRRRQDNSCAVLSVGEESIKSRIRHILQYKKAPVWLLGGTLLILAVLIAGLCSNIRQKDKDAYYEGRIAFACIVTEYTEQEDGGYLHFQVNEGEEGFRGRRAVAKVELTELRDLLAEISPEDITGIQLKVHMPEKLFKESDAYTERTLFGKHIKSTDLSVFVGDSTYQEYVTVSQVYYEGNAIGIPDNHEYWSLGTDIRDAQKRPKDVLDAWASAFRKKDGVALHDLSYDQEAFGAWDMITIHGKGDVSMEEFAAWPTEADYEIFYEKGKEDVTIRYWMRNNVPEVFPCEEQVKLIKAGDLYYVEHVSFTSYEEVDTLGKFVMAYAPYDIRKNISTAEVISRSDNPVYNWTDNTGYEKSHMRYVYDHVAESTEPQYYDTYRDPVTAAKRMLHLGAGSGEVTGYLYMAEPQGSILQQTSADVILGEGSIVNVTYTFAEDGSCVQIPMVLAEETLGLWAVSTGELTGAAPWVTCVSSPASERHTALAGVEGQMTEASTQTGGQTRGALPADADFLARKVMEEVEYSEGAFLQVSDYGIYRLKEESFENIYRDRFPTDMSFYYDSQNRVLYFPLDTKYEEYSAEWTADCICKMDVISGEYRYIPHEKAHSLTGESSFSVRNGFLYLYGECDPFYDAEMVWNGKTTAELSEEEKNAYAGSVREYVLAHPEELIKVSNRYNGWTEAFIDLDGDGKAEEIVVEGIEEQYDAYDHHYFKCNDWKEERYSCHLYNEIWAFSPNGTDIFVVLYEDGPSADPKTVFWRYEKGKLVEAGSIGHPIQNLDIKEGMLYAAMRVDVLQTDWVLVQYGVNSSGDIALIPQQVYTFASQNDVSLKKNLTLYTSAEGSENFVLEPQKVKFVRVTEDFSWVYLEAEDGQTGWFEVEDFDTLADGKKAGEVFDGLYIAG